MKQIISIIVFALLIGAANAQQTQQLFPIYTPTPEMRQNPAAMQALADYNAESIRLRAEYDSLERVISDLDYSKYVYSETQSRQKRASEFANQIDLIMQQRRHDEAVAQGPDRTIQGGTNNAMNSHYGVSEKVLTNDELKNRQKEDLETIHNDIYKKDVALDSKRYDRDLRSEDVSIEAYNTQIETQKAVQEEQKARASDATVAKSYDSVEEAENMNVLAVVQNEKVMKTSGAKTAVHKEGKRLKMDRKLAIQKKKQEKRALRQKNHNDRKQDRIDRQIKRRNGILIVDGEVVSTKQQNQQQHSSCSNSQQNCQQNECYPQPQYDTRTPIEKQYGLSGLGGQPNGNGPVIAPAAQRPWWLR